MSRGAFPFPGVELEAILELVKGPAGIFSFPVLGPRVIFVQVLSVLRNVHLSFRLLGIEIAATRNTWIDVSFAPAVKMSGRYDILST